MISYYTFTHMKGPVNRMRRMTRQTINPNSSNSLRDRSVKRCRGGVHVFGEFRLPPPIGVENFVYPPPIGVENLVYPPLSEWRICSTGEGVLLVYVCTGSFQKFGTTFGVIILRSHEIFKCSPILVFFAASDRSQLALSVPRLTS